MLVPIIQNKELHYQAVRSANIPCSHVKPFDKNLSDNLISDEWASIRTLADYSTVINSDHVCCFSYRRDHVVLSKFSVPNY